MLLRPFLIGEVSFMADAANLTTAAFPAKEAGLRPSYLSADWICGVCSLVLCPSDRTWWTIHHACPVCWTLVCFASLHFSCRESNDFDRPVVDGLPVRCFFRQSFLDRELFEGPLAHFLAATFGFLLSLFPKVSFPLASFEIAWDFRVVRTISHTYSTLLFLLFAVVERVLSLDVQYRP